MTKTIGENIRNARKALDWTQQDLASKMNVQRSYVSQVETGFYTPTIDMLRKFAQALGVPVAVLLEENSEPEPKREVA